MSKSLTKREPTAVAKSLSEHMLSGTSALVPTAKAYFIGEDGANESKALVEQDKSTKLLLSKGALEPAYPPNMLALIFENSSNLRQNVDAYVTNIDSFGHSFVPVIDVDDASASDRIKDALRAEKLAGALTSKAALLDSTKEPTTAEVNARKTQLKIEIRAEREKLEAFFDNCTPTMPFSGPEGLRGLTRQDIEVFGYGYWEVLRNRLGEISQLNRIDGRSVRLMPEDEQPTEVQIDQKVSLLSTTKVKAKKRFRRYVQAYEPGTQVVYFKEFGDPRCVNAVDGRYYSDLKAMTAAVKDKDPKAPVREATEIYPFKITSTRSPYGVPRWIGTLLCVLGTRQAEEVNFLYFENRSVPPMAILVSGGHLNSETVTRLQDYITNEIRGKRNFHKVMILEAEAAAGADPSLSGKMKITLQPLTDAQQKDGLFQTYDERNADKVGQAFRLPRILRGDVRDFNRSCYSEDTETLTESGWKLHDQIGPEEKIAAYDPKTGEVRFVVPAKKLVYDVVNEELWHFESEQTDCFVTCDHKMLSRLSTSDAWTVSTAETMPWKCFYMPCAEDVRGGDDVSKYLPKQGADSLVQYVERERYTGKVYCFSVPEFGFFVTRRNGKTAIQGNTAEAALDFAELQVFGPIRQDFDWRINKMILPALGIKFHTFRSNAPTIRDPELLSKILVDMVTANILVPGEAREMAEQVFNRTLSKISEDWTEGPIGVTLVKAAQQSPGGDDEDGPPKKSGGTSSAMSVPGAGPTQRATGNGASKPTSSKKRMQKAELIASGLKKIHGALLDAEREEFTETLKDAERISVPADIFASFFAKDAPLPAAK